MLPAEVISIRSVPVQFPAVRCAACGGKIKGRHFDGSETMWEITATHPVKPVYYVEEGCLALHDEMCKTALEEKVRYVPPRVLKNRRKRERRARRGKK